MALLETAIAILKPIVVREITEEIIGENSGKVIRRPKKVIDAPKTAAKSSALLSIGVAIIYALSVFGVIPPEVAEAINAILSSEEAKEAAAKALEAASD